VTFGSGFDFCLHDAGNLESYRSYSNLGNCYENDTGIRGREAFASHPFKVEEVEALKSQTKPAVLTVSETVGDFFERCQFLWRARVYQLDQDGSRIESLRSHFATSRILELRVSSENLSQKSITILKI
jgi:hypothetical protein